MMTPAENPDVRTDDSLSDAMKNVHVQTGESLFELSHNAPVLLIFLRHFG